MTGDKPPELRGRISVGACGTVSGSDRVTVATGGLTGGSGTASLAAQRTWKESLELEGQNSFQNKN